MYKENIHDSFMKEEKKEKKNHEENKNVDFGESEK
jgi:hypothetical protein